MDPCSEDEPDGESDCDHEWSENARQISIVNCNQILTKKNDRCEHQLHQPEATMNYLICSVLSDELFYLDHQ